MSKLVALASLVVLSGTLVAALSAASAPSFARAKSYATRCCPESVAISDLNGDGKPDLATANGAEDANGATNTVSVLLNRGDGSFRARRDYGTRGGPASVAIGDLNGDGRPDLATANKGANTVSVLLNRGDGSFEAKRDYATGRHPDSIAIGELNGDRKPDLVTANRLANTVSILLNRGDGSFEAKRDYAIGDSTESVAIGDLNGDGRPDLVTANVDDAVSVLLNRGDGSFQARRVYRTGLHPVSVAIGDLNGDGKPDLATANANGGTVSVLLNRGDGTFRAKRSYDTGVDPESVAIGDLDGDGTPDLATANVAAADDGPDTVSVLTNRGDGSLEAKVDYRIGPYPRSVAIGDLNGDGKPDLATADEDAKTVSVLINTPGLCTVQYVTGKYLPAAKRAIARANCRVGKIRRVYTTDNDPGSVIAQKPKAGTVLPRGGKVNLVVSRGRSAR